MSRSDGKPGPGGSKPATVVDNSTMLDDKPERHRKRELDDLPTMSRDRYAITNEHARGGLGVILAARDEHLGRTVAIKELGAGADERMSTRFVREALITARLQHPGIVPVYEAGRWPTGARFYAMKMVSGKTLREELKARASLEERLALVPNVLAVAEAVAYAHAQGVIHRDLKPDNVMVGAFGETVVVDWGLAKDRKLGVDIAPDKSGLYVQAHAEATRIGAVIGTPAYMSPEQARGEDVDERADVWAIGAILYHLLTAAPPFSGAPDSVIERVAKEPAPRVDDQVKGAPRDLVAIVDKAMARDPAERYANAKELAGDLSRFLTGKLVDAREYSRLALLEHWIRRHRAPVIVGAVLTAVLAIFATISISRIVGERRTARARSDELVLTNAKSQLDRDPTASLAWLKQYPASGSEPETARNIAEDAASRGVARHVWGGHPEIVEAIAVSPDGKTVATSSNKVLQTFDRATGLRTARVDVPWAQRLQFLPDGRIAGGAVDGSVFIVEGGVAKILGKVAGSVDNEGLDVTRDGRTIVAGGSGGNVVAFDVAGGPPHELTRVQGKVTSVIVTVDAVLLAVQLDQALEIRRIALAAPSAVETLARLAMDHEPVSLPVFSENGSALVVPIGDDVLRWDAGSSAFTTVAHQRTPINDVAIGPDGRVVAGGTDGTLTIVAPDGTSRTVVAHYHPITALAFSRDGRLFASADRAGLVNVWTPTGMEPHPGHSASVKRLVFAPDNGVISGSDDQTVRAWLPSGPQKVFAAGARDVFRVTWLSPSRLATTGRDAAVNLIDLDGTVRRIAREGAETYNMTVLPNGDLVTSAWNGAIAIFSPDGVEKGRFDHGKRVWLVAASPDGRQLASCGEDGEVKLWTLATGAMRVLDKHAVDAIGAAFSPDGKLIATSAQDFEIRIFDLTTNAPPKVLKGHTGDPNALTWSADGKTLYSAGGDNDGDVRVWNVATGQSTVLGGHVGQVRTIALSRDQRLLASGGNDGLLIVWDLADGNRPRILPGHHAEIRYVAFAPDGHLLASAGWDGTVRLWNLDDGRVTTWRGHEGKVHRVAFSADGKLLASSGEDGTVRVWTVADQTAIPPDPKGFTAWLDSATTAKTSPTGLLDVVTPN
jgi:eukaryotic-like serine/threonine-protein kinase